METRWHDARSVHDKDVCGIDEFDDVPEAPVRNPARRPLEYEQAAGGAVG